MWPSDASVEVLSGVKDNARRYRFDDVPAGESYVLSVASKRYQFTNPSRLISVSDDLSDVDFVASP